MIFFTSDTHFGHRNVSRYCGRGFDDDLDGMDDMLVNNWNKVVGHNDVVWHLGDVAICGSGRMKECLFRLNGTIHLVLGNHDKEIALAATNRFESIQHVKCLKDNGNIFFLSHYAHRTWPKIHRGAFHLYGHSHGALPGVGRSMDVGVDALDEMAPISINEVVAILEKKTSFTNMSFNGDEARE